MTIRPSLISQGHKNCAGTQAQESDHQSQVHRCPPASGTSLRIHDGHFPQRLICNMLRHAAGYALAGRGIDTRTLQAFMGHKSIANTVVYTAVADRRIRNIWGK